MALRTTQSLTATSPLSVLEQIREDSEFEKFKRVIKREKERLHLLEDEKEVLGLHASRISRTMYDKRQYSAQALMDATSSDLAYRSRMVELRVKASLRISMMEAAIGSIRKYIYTKYVKANGAFSTEASRQAFIDTVLKSYITDVNEARALIELCDTLIKDIDQASFSLRNMLECLKLLSETKGKII